MSEINRVNVEGLLELVFIFDPSEKKEGEIIIRKDYTDLASQMCRQIYLSPTHQNAVQSK